MCKLSDLELRLMCFFFSFSSVLSVACPLLLLYSEFLLLLLILCSYGIQSKSGAFVNLDNISCWEGEIRVNVLFSNFIFSYFSFFIFNCRRNI